MATTDPTTGLPTATTTPAVATTNPVTTTPATTLPTITSPTYTPGQNFTFDPNTYLPAIQTQAASIYDPQTAQLKALQQISQNQTAQSKITTQQQFDKQLAAEVESINQRGAFFGGGAINDQAQMQQTNTNALNNLDLQQQAADAQTQGQLGSLAGQEAQYIQGQLTTDQSSAYNQWKDAYDMWNQQQQQTEAKAESDRTYALEIQKLDEQKKQDKISAKEYKQSKKQAEDQYNSDLQYKYAALAAKGSGSSSSDTNIY